MLFRTWSHQRYILSHTNKRQQSFLFPKLTLYLRQSEPKNLRGAWKITRRGHLLYFRYSYGVGEGSNTLRESFAIKRLLFLNVTSRITYQLILLCESLSADYFIYLNSVKQAIQINEVISRLLKSQQATLTSAPHFNLRCSSCLQLLFRHALFFSSKYRQIPALCAAVKMLDFPFFSGTTWTILVLFFTLLLV